MRANGRGRGREAGSRDEMETGLNPLFALLFFFAFVAGKRRGRFWFWLLLLLLLRKQQTTKGVIVYMYCIVCTIIHIHLLFSVWSDAAIEVNSLLFCFLFHFVLVRRARRGYYYVRCGRFRDRLVSISRERVKKCRRTPGRRERNKTDRQETQALRGS